MSVEVDQQIQDNVKKAHIIKGETDLTYSLPVGNFAEWLEGITKKYAAKPCVGYYPSVSAQPEWHTYQELNRKVNRIVNFLCMKLGVRYGDTVATLLTNQPDTIATYLAVIKLGATLVPLSPETDDKSLLYQIQNINTKVVVSQDKFIDRLLTLKKSAPTFKHLVKVGEMKDEETILFNESVSISSPIFSPKEMTTLDDNAIIVYTSGTMDLPRGVVINQYNLLIKSLNIAQFLSYTETTRVLSVLPLYYVNEFVTSVLALMGTGATIIMTPVFEPALFAKIIAQEKVNSVNLTPHLLQQCLDNRTTLKAANLSTMKYFISGEGALDPKLAREIRTNLGIKVIQGYGLSETTGYVTLVNPDISERDYQQWLETQPLSVGTPLNNINISVLDENGQELPAGKPGEIVIRGHPVMKGYYKIPEVNKEVFKFGWFHTGDIGFHKSGPGGKPFLYLSGRLKEVINRGGEKITPAEIESVLYEIAGVKWGLVVGFNNKWTGEEIGAYIVPEKEGAITDKEIKEYCQTKLGYAKSPKAIVFGKEIPAGTSRHTLRQQLRAQFAPWGETKLEQT